MRTAAEIEALVVAFEGCTLPKTEWTHREHITVALLYLLRHARRGNAAHPHRDPAL